MSQVRAAAIHVLNVAKKRKYCPFCTRRSDWKFKHSRTCPIALLEVAFDTEWGKNNADAPTKQL